MKKQILYISLLVITILCSCSEDIKSVTTDKVKVSDLKFTDLFYSGMKKGVGCYRIPAIVTATNGDLLAAIDERVLGCADLRGNRDINIIIRRSTDNGKTWLDVETVVDFPLGKSASDPSMIVDRNTKAVFLFYNYMDVDKEKNVYYLHVVKSVDNGKTWGDPIDITSQISKSEWHKDFKFITSGRGIQTQDGTLLHTMVNLNHGLRVFGSKDHGETWFFIDTPVKPADESKILQLADGSWMINARANGKGMRFVHRSTDQGKTWETKSEPNLIDPGCNASIIRYTSIKDGYKVDRLLFSNAKTKKSRQNMTVRISYDEGKTWSKGKTIYLGRAAYSSLTILKNGEIGIFFEKDEYSKNSFVSFSLDWLTDGKDKYEQPNK